VVAHVGELEGERDLRDVDLPADARLVEEVEDGALGEVGGRHREVVGAVAERGPGEQEEESTFWAVKPSMSPPSHSLCVPFHE
jgi:hypothetical protein